METEHAIFMKKAGEIIMNEGLSALTIYNLAAELALSEDQLYKQFGNDDDILLFILADFEKEINDYVGQFADSIEAPETELKLLFESVYFLFLQKPFYLSIIFDKSLIDRNVCIKKSIFRIKTIAENYLGTIINKGKMENTFKTKVPTKTLVNKILSGFRFFMKDEHLLNEMVLELKTLKD